MKVDEVGALEEEEEIHQDNIHRDEVEEDGQLHLNDLAGHCRQHKSNDDEMDLLRDMKVSSAREQDRT